MQSIWDFAFTNCPRGDIGRFSDEEIAFGIDYSGDPDASPDVIAARAAELIAALTDSKWLDLNEDHRLIIHDWSDHCEDYIHRKLALAGERFADGSLPSLTRLNSAQKKKAETAFSESKNEQKSGQKSENVRTNAQSSVQCAHECAPMRTKCAPTITNAITIAIAKPLPKSAECVGGSSEPISTTSADKNSSNPSEDFDQSTNSGGVDTSYAQEKNSQPEPISAISKKLLFDVKSVDVTLEVRAEAFAIRAQKLSGDPESWTAWFYTSFLTMLKSYDGDRFITDTLKRISDSGIPSKDVGKFKTPGKWIVKEICAFMKAHKMRWNDHPETTEKTP
jgi:hypothetical protein